MNLRRCPVCEGMVLEIPGPPESPRGMLFERHLPANASKEPATHMDGACFGSYGPTLVATPERGEPMRSEDYDVFGMPQPKGHPSWR